MAVIVETERRRIRDWTLEDAAAAFALWGDERVTRFLGYTTPDVETQRQNLGRLIEFNRQRPAGLGAWAIEERAAGEVVGCALLKELEGSREVEVGWHLQHRVWGKGYATEAGRACLEHGFRTVGLARILALVHAANTPSLAVVHRLGMEPIGTRQLAGEELLCFEQTPDGLPQA